MAFPTDRPRRLRSNSAIRSLVRENRLSASQLILPLFVIHGANKKEAIRSMPDVYRYSVDNLSPLIKEALSVGIRSVILFGIPEKKDEMGSSALDPEGPVPTAVRMLKRDFPDLVVMTDVCIDEYTTHGHCGLLKGEQIDNDTTLDCLAKMSLVHAQAGADIVAPSDMMDGRVKALRETLDKNGFSDTIILSYAVKYASAFYGPFRDAMMSGPQFGDRSSYQMDPANRLEAFREASLDVEEGADILMVKPALPYLDILRDLAGRFDLPLCAYQVSGEYSTIMAAGKEGWIDTDRAMMESLLSIRRAGATMILTYFAIRAARLLAQSE
ncbi:porphobilinogen synthase [Leptospirillum ferriphilum]|uniref:Delta-aminolevulinic acid dehydratase n=1 Tax=Leptospirillum ferriphilum (strain ML-04) TaxID=1048260 RepID=J9ZDF2_LEPFM|nr:porphobilinogen synthase [Leptospirillum ferriphilum]AFS54186.1 porphobilinogen synthase [Leptospirillum ferriphilum ML-04]